jgi:hypothetical protein
MESTNLFLICGVSFLMVFFILILLALSMRLIIFLFPEKKATTDAAIIAALTATMQNLFPGTNVTKIEEKS